MISGGEIIGVGIDAVDVERFRNVLGRRRGFAERVFTAAERAEAAARHDPVPGLAARFAAKEAIMKSLSVGLGAFDFADVEVVRGEGGAPALTVTGRAARLAAERSVSGWHISLTHTATVAMAIAVAHR
ncbi:MAG TPA: holo-ACP synthase [Acidimicrobiia bacterium]|nr:holo-ACP synthase [Acidimicrobiia bacterium]